MANFQNKPSAGIQVAIGIRDEAAYHVQAVSATEQGKSGIMQHLSGQGGTARFRNIREIGHNAVISPVHRVKQITPHKPDMTDF